MRKPLFRARFEDELVVDNFAGGGGATNGIVTALDRPVDMAINHDPVAIEMHRQNHPETRHFCENIWEVDPREACSGRRVGLAWFSPDCDHFSRARGAKPKNNKIRGLAWVVTRWARAVRPRVIVLENVGEFQSWGPLDDEGHPVKARAGETFRAWLSQLVDLGYAVEYRELVAADYGTPTTRKRLFLVARCDGLPIVWPEPTHGPGRAYSWRSAAEIIDWGLPCPSIFERKRPLAEATLKRIAIGVRRFVLNSADPFILPLTHQGDSRVHSIHEPLRTVTAAHRGELVLAEPFLVRHGHYSNRTGAGLVAIKGGPGVFRGQQLRSPLATICATNDKHLVCPIISKHFGGEHASGAPKAVGSDARAPLSTITARRQLALTSAFLTKFYGTSVGSDLRRPVPTITGQAGGGHLAEVRALLAKYSGGASLGQVNIHGELYEVVDVGMRMIQPAELFRAQGFPDDYVISFDVNGKTITKEAQTRLAGNSVCRDVAEAVVAANAQAA